MKKDDCIFCKIANGDFGTEFIIETEDIVAFHDLNPQAPEHILVIPKNHYDNLSEIDNTEILGKLLEGVQLVTKKLELKEYRTVINTGKNAGQSVFHVHVHVLGGKILSESIA